MRTRARDARPAGARDRGPGSAGVRRSAGGVRGARGRVPHALRRGPRHHLWGGTRGRGRASPAGRDATQPAHQSGATPPGPRHPSGRPRPGPRPRPRAPPAHLARGPPACARGEPRAETPPETPPCPAPQAAPHVARETKRRAEGAGAESAGGLRRGWLEGQWRRAGAVRRLGEPAWGGVGGLGPGLSAPASPHQLHVSRPPGQDSQRPALGPGTPGGGCNGREGMSQAPPAPKRRSWPCLASLSLSCWFMFRGPGVPPAASPLHWGPSAPLLLNQAALPVSPVQTLQGDSLWSHH